MSLSRRSVIGLVSIAGHVIMLLAVVLFTGGGDPRPAPEAIAVDIVPADEAPPPSPSELHEGTPLESTSRGSEMSSDSASGSASTGAPRARMTAPPSLAQHAATSPTPAGGSALAAPAGETMPLPRQTPDAAPQPQEQQDQQHTLPDARDRMAMVMALPGGKTAVGLDPQSNTPAMLEHDDIAAFRVRFSQCSASIPGRAVGERTAILLRISFKRDGTLAAPPRLLESPLSVDAVELTRIAVAALERCQPYPELPADKYQKWKTLDLVVAPLSLSQ